MSVTFPAVALLEFDSVAAGIVAGDAMIKRAPLGDLVVGTVQPGHYLVLIAGDVASVDEAIQAGLEVSGHSLLDRVFLPDVHGDVVAAIRGERRAGPVEALGIVETTYVASVLEAADAGIKGADVVILDLYVADGLGGKGYVLFGGPVHDVEAAVEIGSNRVPAGHLTAGSVISQLHPDMRSNLEAHARFARRAGREPEADGAAG
jgi:microcompartment protein CcmL/EutN